MRRRLATATFNVAVLTAVLVGFSLGIAPATAEAAQAPTITPSITCDSLGAMTITVQIDGKLPEQHVTVTYAASYSGGGTVMADSSHTFSNSVSSNRFLRMWVNVDGATAYDSGEVYSSLEAGCGVPAPPLGEGVIITPSSKCVGGGLDYGVTVDAHQSISYEWWAGDLSDEGVVDFKGVDTINKVIPVGSAFRLYLNDFLDRTIFDSGDLAAVAGSDCSAPATRTADAFVTLACVEQAGQAVAGGTNTGNVPLDVAVYGSLNGASLPSKYGTLQPGETLALDPIAVVATDVVAAQVNTGDSKKGSGTILDTATVTVDGTICEPIPEVTPTVPITAPPATTVPEPTPTTTPGPSETTIPVATTTPTTTGPTTTGLTSTTVDPSTPPRVESAGAVGDTGPRDTLPRTGSDMSGPVALGLSLLAVGAALAATARRSAHRG